MKKHSMINIFSLERIFRETVEPRRRQEQRDGDMISKGQNSIANLPQEPINRQFKTGFQVERFVNAGNEE
jgi:hypothetical protein